ncbi:HDOD domain-containing protein [Marinobacter sp. SS21]|uniref:HDOD domain-containing protein n=1 Tax=Marinobacter sp. SS21 TaxID=2979460 RepID=UPI00232CB600|nr:HDOD domain-containing protein [Marinobacter sp. SS21]MDC0662985.1 HDOD domain-containing protein [Marinobacter sp. SS21]
MKALILEDDLLMAELLETILAGLYARFDACIVSSVTEAKQAWEPDRFQLVICDWNLPDGSGLDVVRYIRQQDHEVPVLMISGRSDRESVLAAAHHRISGFIGKPFKVEMVRDRLKSIFPPEAEPDEPCEDLEQMLTAVCNGHFQLPTTLEPSEILTLMERPETLDATQLAERWRDETGLTTRLLDVANASSYRATGEPVGTLAEAIRLIGTKMSLNLALGLAMDATHTLSDPRLRERAEAYQRQCEEVGRHAQQMFRKLAVSEPKAFTAGLLSRAGELVVLSVLQQYLNNGGSLSDERIEQALGDWAQPCGNRLKVVWRLPLDLRELIGAIHFLPRGNARQDRIVMRAASMIGQGQGESAECQRLLRFAGLDPEDYANAKDASE